MKRISIFMALGLLAMGAASAEAEGRKANTFAGSCEFAGSVTFAPPLTNSPQPARGSARAIGTCDGTFKDRRGRTHQLEESRVTYVAANRGEMMSCGGGTAEGGGYLRYRRSKLRFALTETRGPGAAALLLDGTSGGKATGEAAVSAEEDPLEIAQKCEGPGLDAARITIELQSPGISG
jgi:hypothetical protein